MSQFDWAILARLVRPQGRHGEIIAELLTDFPQRFAERKRLFLLSSETSATAARNVSLEGHWLHKGRVVLKFAGVDSIADAQALRGLLVAIPASERASLTDDSIYISDLIDCEVVNLTSSPAALGRIKDLDREAGLLIVQPVDGEEILVPFAKAYLVSIDASAKRVEMRLPEGLLEINAPITGEEKRELDTREDDSEADI
ncbi:MAG: 16S rRNA processing protein RimM [Acidobacteriaceae bacterium]|nr:16S rRNA processing protein RimM [Acidobacteriaceae bacterium]